MSKTQLLPYVKLNLHGQQIPLVMVQNDFHMTALKCIIVNARELNSIVMYSVSVLIHVHNVKVYLNYDAILIHIWSLRRTYVR